ncbi:redox-sensing transcriptional repressor Rex [Brevibacillus sp. SYP-B805]|uniref:redox-sensing transcriptional repressor Rex n=1 Tax=Brevibacillus sp. SYP-B805 TaxID=1578199 RepID=UPI0013EC9324|nr:redox-sensing transcriptional repressor Rex [Brevibacillus sp. SYP-B805]
MAKAEKISEAVVRRLPIYLRYLTHLQQLNVTTVSSQQMGKTLDINPAQIRKDLAAFGDFGKKGIGYDVNYLIEKIRQILKLDQVIHVALVGAGHLGHAISNYNAYLKDNMRIVAIFDADKRKIGKKIAGIPIQPLSELKSTVAEKQIRLAIITVPAHAAQEVADQLIHAGIEGILNFAPVTLRTDKNVRIDYADVTSSLQSLAYYLN